MSEVKEDKWAKRRVHFYKKGTLYLKQNEQPMADVPLKFWSTIVQLSTKRRDSLCFVANLERMYANYPNKKTYRKYMKELMDCDCVLRIGKHSYMLNPNYIHRGSHLSTEKAIENYEREKDAQKSTGGKTPWKHEEIDSVNSTMARLAKYIRES